MENINARSNKEKTNEKENEKNSGFCSVIGLFFGLLFGLLGLVLCVIFTINGSYEEKLEAIKGYMIGSIYMVFNIFAYNLFNIDKFCFCVKFKKKK